MELLNTYDNKEDAECAELLISGIKRLASERDGTETIYNLFGEASWNNFYKLDMFKLVELKFIVEQKISNKEYDQGKHQEILAMLRYAANRFSLTIPLHWN